MFRLFAFTNYFEKGYFINNNDERTICLIKNLDWRYNPRAFHYKLSEESVVVSENIDGVKEFGIDNESCYKRFTAKIERSLNETNYLNYEKNPVFKEETLFLKTVASGSANLYSYTDENVIKYFYETASKPIEQLVRVRYLSKDSITSYEESVAENNLFRLQLIGALKCSAMAESDFRRLEYKKAPLAKVFEKFNSCNGDPKINGIDFSQKANRKSFAFKIAPGVFAANMAISDPSGFYSVSTDLTQTALKLGFEIEYILPFAKGSWSLFIDPAYQNFNASKSYSNRGGFDNQMEIDYDATADYAFIEFPVGLRRYFFMGRSSKIFFNAAYVYNFTTGDPTVTFTNTNNLPNASKIMPIISRFNVALGVGYNYKRWSIEFRANAVRQTSGYGNWTSKYTTNGFILAYQFL